MDSRILRFTVFFLVFSFAEGWWFQSPQVCYGDLGCFSLSYPFINTFGKLPKSPSEIDTKCFLFTRSSSMNFEELVPSSLNELKPIKMIIHGFAESAEKQWVEDMVTELLEYDDYYVIVVDWRKGAAMEYLQAVANTRVVGAVLAQLLQVLRDENGFDPADMHIIGYSLGAHIAGYIGENFANIGRISGLDPAGPAFENTEPVVRLDQTDAMFVDVIHTDTKHIFNPGLGIKRRSGTVDFYPNGGKDQPGCSTVLYALMDWLSDADSQDLVSDLSCSHRRSVELFIESINTACLFKAYPCPDLSLSSSCNSCGTGCHRMGFHASTSMNPGQFYVQTNQAGPYCMEYH
ncbi:pancreatic lipase-related protein 2-like [Mercenaria mercenaria]|uniref:pancreatic lipase-related protein 2-like n=1 Tax=Mercenaria mercenaria TaxID=6596 RepID=UPI00234EB29C|nr:pancreatic lipase-related protein 2-like [Mercenaria mercenaria]